MRYEIVLAPDAVADLRRLRAYQRSQVRDALEMYLRHEPVRTSKARIKRLRGLRQPQYRLRVGDDLRVYYDVTSATVQVLAVVSKQDAEAWLRRKGTPE